jgi:hypothetical protein
MASFTSSPEPFEYFAIVLNFWVSNKKCMKVLYHTIRERKPIYTCS